MTAGAGRAGRVRAYRRDGLARRRAAGRDAEARQEKEEGDSGSGAPSSTAEQAHVCERCERVEGRCESCGQATCGCDTQGPCLACGAQDECRRCSWGRDHGTRCGRCARFMHWHCAHGRCEAARHRFCRACHAVCRTCHATLCPACAPLRSCKCG